ncbi:hypothetical protein E1202_14945 [Saccharopolyspora karakumensis]|uniref:Uncharacterized protein n=1 Tax=Saccharopolyspora karakumensis TaxID=2530386 RepID=A0A4R5BRK0_9PSEU|nr:hypothetical protein [Saccharopolyspora karakumensis]TDD88083.1 hypothetical protein E1202_14945 [Saccharopolyspora karakumensis]
MYAAAVSGGVAAAALLTGCAAGQTPRTVYVETPAPPPPPRTPVEQPRGECGIDPARMSEKTKARCGLVVRESADRHCGDPEWWDFSDPADVHSYFRVCTDGPIPVPVPVPVPVPYEVPSPPSTSESAEPRSSVESEVEAPETSPPESPQSQFSEPDTSSVEPDTGSSEEAPSSEDSTPAEESDSGE